MTAILNISVPAAGTYVGSTYQLREPSGSNPVMEAHHVHFRLRGRNHAQHLHPDVVRRRLNVT